jgi:hypothetical protein
MQKNDDEAQKNEAIFSFVNSRLTGSWKLWKLEGGHVRLSVPLVFLGGPENRETLHIFAMILVASSFVVNLSQSRPPLTSRHS